MARLRLIPGIYLINWFIRPFDWLIEANRPTLILDTGYWILDAGFWTLDAGCWTLDLTLDLALDWSRDRHLRISNLIYTGFKGFVLASDNLSL